MRIVYAFRRTTFYPDPGREAELPPKEVRGAFLRKVKEIGFEGLELAVPRSGEAEARALRREVEEAGLPCAAVRGGGPSLHPRDLAGNRERMEAAIHAATWLGAPVVNASIGMPRPSSARGTLPWGEATCWGSSRDASEADFERAAAAFAAVALLAADHGIAIAIELHQHCLVDNSWSALHLMELIDHPAVGLNPDLGNVYWTYHVPEESGEQAIAAMAPYAKYWHLKNLRRTYVPGQEFALFHQTPLPDGEIDYRFAVSAMLAAGYQGDFAIEGLRLGDAITGDARSAGYIRGLIQELGR
jgi:sugar phosphate isomerase/epimerase